MERMFHLLALCLLFLCSNAAEDVAELGREKLEHLLEESEANNGLIQIKGSDFEKYISKGPRPYYCVVVLTAIESGNCSPCEQVQPEIEKLGEMIEKQRNLDDETQIFLMEADFLQNRNTFQKLALQTAPMIVMVPPAKTKKEISLSKFFKSIGAKHQYSLATGRNAEDIGGWISKVAKIELDFGGKVELPTWAFTYGIPMIGMVIGAWYLGWLDVIRRSMLLYAVVSIAAYGFFIGGGWFSIIRETPWVHVDKGQVSYISHMSRYQYTLEGYLVGAANLAAGVGAFLYINGQRDGWKRDKNGKIISRWWSRYVPVWLTFLVVAVGWYGIMWAYNRKNGHYNFGRVGMKG